MKRRKGEIVVKSIAGVFQLYAVFSSGGGGSVILPPVGCEFPSGSPPHRE